MQVFIIGMMWLLFIGMLLRSIWTERIRTAPSRRFLLQIFLSCLALSFWGKEAEEHLDQYFKNLPVGVYLKYFSLLWVAHLFDMLVRESIEGWQERYRCLKVLVPLAYLLGMLSFILYMVYQPIDKNLLRYLLIGARDAWILLINVLIFVPAVFMLWQREKVAAMRCRLLCSLITTICYSLTVISSVTAAGLAVYSFDWAAQAADLAKPFIVLGAFAFIPVFIPHRVLNILIHLRRFFTYYQLKRLRKQIAPIQELERQPIRNLAELELAIYRNMIAILDYYPPLEEHNKPLYQAIALRVAEHREYEDLLQAMVRL